MLGLLVILIVAFYSHWGELNDVPIGIHAWSQYDRYAIALGFLDNGFDFFHPQTFVYNKQFPGVFLEPYATTVTSVDFPIHEYVVALFMKVLGITSPWVFRVYTLSYSLIGLLFFYLFVKEETDSKIKAWSVIVLVMLSPIYFHYQASFIPAIMSLANVMIAYRYYFLYVENRSRLRNMYIAAFFFLLAALTRTPFVLFLIAVVCQEILMDVFIHKKTVWQKWTVFVSAFAIVGLYYLFNNSLRNEYGSIFLGSIMPAGSFWELWGLTKKVFHNWAWHYFTIYHGVCFISLLVLVFLVNARFKFSNSLFIQIVIAGFGCLCYWLLMVKQYVDHDYYFLDTFFIVVLLAFVVLLKISIGPYGTSRIWWRMLFCIVGVAMFLQFESIKKQRCFVDQTDRGRITINNFKNAHVFLESIGVHKNAKILVIDSYIPNAPLLLMKRKGYVIMSTTYENISEALGWDYDYIVVQNQFFESDIISVFPNFGLKVESIGGDGKISIFKKR